MSAVALVFCIATAQAGDNVRFNYQGRVLVDGTPFEGTGQLKLAIVATSGTTVSVWSNDQTSAAGAEPTTHISTPVAAGIFDLMVGDESLGMAPIHGALFLTAATTCACASGSTTASTASPNSPPTAKSPAPLPWGCAQSPRI